MAANRFDQLIAQWEDRLRKAFLDAVANVADQAQLDQITKMLAQGDLSGALRAVGLDPAQFRPFDKALAEAFEAGGNATIKALPPATDRTGMQVRFQFNVRNREAENWLRTYSATLVKDVMDDQRQMIRDVLERGLSKGLNPKTVALDLVGRVGPNGHRQGGLIGLTASQEQWVQAYSDELVSDNPRAALARTLRDKRFDGAVLKAAASGQPIPPDLRASMVTAYRNRALRYRAETIARKESITALHEAQDQALKQAISTGGVHTSQVTMVWHSAHDNRVREAHRELNGTSIQRGGTFHSILGPIRYPGDPKASAANVINCRCWLEPKVDFLAGIR
jgi:hypothetical protein